MRDEFCRYIIYVSLFIFTLTSRAPHIETRTDSALVLEMIWRIPVSNHFFKHCRLSKAEAYTIYIYLSNEYQGQIQHWFKRWFEPYQCQSISWNITGNLRRIVNFNRHIFLLKWESCKSCKLNFEFILEMAWRRRASMHF